MLDYEKQSLYPFIHILQFNNIFVKTVSQTNKYISTVSCLEHQESVSGTQHITLANGGDKQRFKDSFTHLCKPMFVSNWEMLPFFSKQR